MDLERRVDCVVRNAQEVLTPDELRGLFEREARPKAYIGFEPSGELHVGHLVTARKMQDLLEAGCDLTVFLADWHAWINDKMGGSLERIQDAGRTMQRAFGAVGVDPDRARYRWAHELAASSEYWARVLRVAKATTLARTRRATTIMGRSEEEGQTDTARLFYPAMQVADIFELPVSLAYAGVDQRRAHVLAREAAHQHDWPVPVAIHTPLVSSLRGGGRMDPLDAQVERKMSKSDPTASIPVTADPATIRERVQAAFCPAREVDGNPVADLARFVVLPWSGHLALERAERHGGAVEFSDAEEFLRAWRSGAVHPQDLKNAVASSLVELLEPVRRRLAVSTEVGRAESSPVGTSSRRG